MAVKKSAKKAVKKPAMKAKSKVSVAPKVLKAISAKQTKSQILQAVAQETGLTLKQVKAVFVSANQMLQKHMIKKGSGEFLIPEMGIKVMRKIRPATKKRMGRNPMTGEAVMIAAKPKKEIIRLRALKALKGVLS